jgi:hypothetical protein
MRQENEMEDREQRPQTLVERVLALLEEHFPWLASGNDEPVSGADTVNEINDLYQSLLGERDKDHGNDRVSEL